MAVPDKVLELVERFEYNIDAYKQGKYNETQVRREFIDPLFTSLGWDVDNEQGYAEAYKDVVHEDAIKVGHATKAPDYSFRIGGVRKFFVEAKKPSIDIKDDIHPAYQLRRYAWSAKLPLSILTDFEEFAVYDCRVKPEKTDKSAKARIMYLTYSDYPQQWEDLVNTFSREAILKGAFDKYAESKKAKKGTAEVDVAFLQEIERWRELLARNIALRNSRLSLRELNFAVQRTIDRLIFLRICEDRGIEGYGKLMALQNGTQVYQRLLKLFSQADDRYNSGIFHFKTEKERTETPDALTPELTIDDTVLKDMLKNLYYPDSPYEFSVLPADILGQVYEQFLGKVIRLTVGHQAKVEEKPEVKKAGGVFYTPTYIVEYIVKHTVGELLNGKTPKQTEKLTILDPACGSGSFLLGAYQYLLDWDRDQYLQDPQKWSKGRQPRLYQIGPQDWKLTIDERKRILLTHIYGVDIDSQAVEVTKLSLLLKVLEGEDEQTLTSQMALFHQRVLPDLSNNIKCGNSLIGSDFYEGQQLMLLDEEEMYRINPFDWDKEFPEIKQKGGFDAVIGNPPYVRQELLGDFKPYFQKTYQTYNGTSDLYVYFIEKGVSLLRSGGFFDIIVANKWLRARYGEPLRQWLKQQCLVEITDFGDLPVFQRATTYPCILCIQQKTPTPTFEVTQVKTLQFADLQTYVTQHCYKVPQNSLEDNGWSLVDERTQILLEKLHQTGIPLGEYMKGKIYRGVLTGLNKAFVIDAMTREKLLLEDPRSKELIKPFLVGKDVKRYQPPHGEWYLILMPNGWTSERIGKTKAWIWLQDNYPAIANHLHPFAEKSQKRWDKGEYWWELRACDYYKEFEKPKIIIPSIVKTASYSFDTEGFYSNDKTSIIATNDLYLLGILNSKVSDFVMHLISSTKQGGYFEYKPMYLQQLPIRAIDVNNPTDKAYHAQMVELVERMLDLHKQLQEAKVPQAQTMLKRQIEATDRQLDRFVYELYGLTEAEIEIVEIGTS